jgi:hypothetical protein
MPELTNEGYRVVRTYNGESRWVMPSDTVSAVELGRDEQNVINQLNLKMELYAAGVAVDTACPVQTDHEDGVAVTTIPIVVEYRADTEAAVMARLSAAATSVCNELMVVSVWPRRKTQVSAIMMGTAASTETNTTVRRLHLDVRYARIAARPSLSWRPLLVLCLFLLLAVAVAVAYARMPVPASFEDVVEVDDRSATFTVPIGVE